MTTQIKILLAVLVVLLFVTVFINKKLVLHTQELQQYIKTMPVESRECPKLEVQGRLL